MGERSVDYEQNIDDDDGQSDDEWTSFRLTYKNPRRNKAKIIKHSKH